MEIFQALQCFKDQFPSGFEFSSAVPEKRWLFATPLSLNNDCIHYEIQARNDGGFSIEFHVECRNGDLEKKLNEGLPLRLYNRTSYYSSRMWGTRNLAFSPEDIKADVSTLRKYVDPILDGLSKTTGAPQDDAEVSCRDVTLKELFRQALTLPKYQRGYCWRKENIVTLLNSVANWITGHKDPAAKYHLGTVILKKSNGNYDVIDGQQRLLTLAMLLMKLGPTNRNLFRSSAEGTENMAREHVAYLLRAKRTIDEWVRIHTELTEKEVEERVQFCVVTLNENTSEDLAYLFFKATNATGMRLSDYDLLKTHHLRYVPDSTAEFCAGRWNRMNEDAQKLLLHKILYRLRNWSHNKDFWVPADETADHELFRHFSVKREPISGLFEVPLASRFDSTLNGGMEFFSYVENYRSRWSEFEQTDGARILKKFLAGQNHVLYEAILAVTFLFYCKFGECYLREAVFCTAYRLSSIRNEYAIREQFLRNRPVFAEAVCSLAQATLVGEYFAWALDPVARYQAEYKMDEKRQPRPSVRNAYWAALSGLLGKLIEKSGFSLGTIIVESIKQTVSTNK